MGRLDDVLRTATMAADSAFLDGLRTNQITNAQLIRAAVRAAFECALGNSLIEITDPETWPTYVAIDPPYKPGFPSVSAVGPEQNGTQA